MYKIAIVLFVFTLGDDYDILFMGSAKCIYPVVLDMFKLKYIKMLKPSKIHGSTDIRRTYRREGHQEPSEDSGPPRRGR